MFAPAFQKAPFLYLHVLKFDKPLLDVASFSSQTSDVWTQISTIASLLHCAADEAL